MNLGNLLTPVSEQFLVSSWGLLICYIGSIELDNIGNALLEDCLYLLQHPPEVLDPSPPDIRRRLPIERWSRKLLYTA
jgi:hypothetical protein